MKLTKNTLRAIIKEQMASDSVEEAYEPLPQDAARIESDPGAAIDHLDSGLANLDADVSELMRDIDRLDGRFESLKKILFKMTGYMKKGSAPAAEEPMVDAEFREDSALAENLKKELDYLLKENIEDVAGADAAGAGADMVPPKQESDVKRMIALVGRIDNPKEYSQLLNAIMQHGGNVPQGELILRRAYRTMPALIKGLKGK